MGSTSVLLGKQIKGGNPSGTAERVESLDYLRGLLAVAVMVYHYATWAGASLNAGTFLGRLGIYAVSMFYVLSGLSLMLVYQRRWYQPAAFRQYAIHRVFRIVPLFWVVVSLSLLLAVAPAIVRGIPFPSVDPWRAFLNYSLLFSFVRPEAYYSTGAWSIGNEVVFYAIFPILLGIGMRNRVAIAATALLAFAIAARFTAAIDPSQPLAASWVTYINPLNQLPFFIAGVLIAKGGGEHQPTVGRPSVASGCGNVSCASSRRSSFPIGDVGYEIVFLSGLHPHRRRCLPC